MHFITECSFNTKKESEDSSQKARESKRQIVEVNEDNHAYQWNMHVDRATGPTRNGAGAILEGSNELVVSYAL